MVARERTPLEEFADFAETLFNAPDETPEKSGFLASNGFIEYSSNLHAETPSSIPCLSIPYGFPDVWYKRKKGYDNDRLKILRERRKKDTKVYLRDLNLITLEDIYDLFENSIYLQNNYGAVLENAIGERITVKRGRYNLEPGARASYIQKRVRKELEPFKQVVMLSLTMHQPRVQEVMPDNTNLLPIEYAILHCWAWLNSFLKRLRGYMERRSLPWGYIGAVLEFQDDLDNNGFPHFHLLFTNRWLGPIDEIAALWPWCPENGVDFMTKAKWEKENPGKKYTPLRLAKYLSKYLSKAKFYDTEKGVHKCHAIAAFYGVRMFNFSHEYKAEKDLKKDNVGVWKYIETKSA